MATGSTVVVSLTHDQALVLFDWVSREDGKNSLTVEHEAVRQALWAIEGRLERTLVEPLTPDYASAVSAARERIVSGEPTGRG